MENQLTREPSQDALTETYSTGFRETATLNNADAGTRQNAQCSADSLADDSRDEQRTAQRWWLRKRLMGL